MRRLSGLQTSCYHPDSQTDTHLFFPSAFLPYSVVHIREKSSMMCQKDRSELQTPRYVFFLFSETVIIYRFSVFEFIIPQLTVVCKATIVFSLEILHNTICWSISTVPLSSHTICQLSFRIINIGATIFLSLSTKCKYPPLMWKV